MDSVLIQAPCKLSIYKSTVAQVKDCLQLMANIQLTTYIAFDYYELNSGLIPAQPIYHFQKGEKFFSSLGTKAKIVGPRC